MAGTLPILKIRSSNFLVGLLTAIPMTCYNERKIFKILKFLTHPTLHRDILKCIFEFQPSKIKVDHLEHKSKKAYLH